jgi:capsular exopolysaccharide synthesis family protein
VNELIPQGDGRNDQSQGLLQGGELQAFVSLLARRKLLIGLVTLLGVLIGGGLALTSPKIYEASALLRISASSTNGSVRDVQDASVSQAQTDAATINDRSFLTQTAAKLGLSADLVLARVSADTVTDTALIRVHATGTSPDDARALAQAVADYAVKAISQTTQATTTQSVKALSTKLDEHNAVVTDLIKQLGDLPASSPQRDALTARINAEQSAIQPLISEIAQLQGQLAPAITQQGAATALDVPISPRPLFDTALGLFFGLVLGIIAAWLREQLDRTVRSVAELEQHVRQPVLGVVPILRTPSPSASTELQNVFDSVRVQLGIASANLPGRLFTITSAREGEGKTFTTLGVARALARAGRRVLVIDADLRRKGLSHQLEVDRQPGVTEVLCGHVDPADAIVEPEPNLAVLPGGGYHASPPALFDSQSFELLLEAAREQFDVVLLDTPPIRQVADAVLTGARSDGVLLVVRLGTITRADLKASVDLVSAAPFTLVGEIVHSADASVEDYAYEGRHPRRGLGFRRLLERDGVRRAH